MHDAGETDAVLSGRANTGDLMLLAVALFEYLLRGMDPLAPKIRGILQRDLVVLDQ